MKKIIAVFIFIAVTCSPSFVFAQWIKAGGPPGITIQIFYNYNSDVFAGTRSKGIFKSSDNGLTWTASNAGMENTGVFCITENSQYLFAGTSNGVYRSQDNGATWIAVNPGLQNIEILSLVTTGNYIFAGTRNAGIYRSDNNGASWANVSGTTLTGSTIHCMFYNSPILVVQSNDHLYSSNSMGFNWTEDQGPTATYSIDHFYVNGDTIMASAGDNIFRSENGGDSWNNPINLGANVHISGFAYYNGVLYAGYNDGVFISSDWGDSWAQIISTGIKKGNTINTAFDISGANFILGFEELGIFTSSDNGFNWNESLNGLPEASTVTSAYNSGSLIWAGTAGNGLWQSADNGITWSSSSQSPPMNKLEGDIISDIIQDGIAILAATCGDGLYRSVNNGQAWTKIISGIPSGYQQAFGCISQFSKSDQYLLAATEEGIFYSSDNGLNWNVTSLTGSGYHIKSIAANSNVVCAAVDADNGSLSGIYRSDDGGVTWSQLIPSITGIEKIITNQLSGFFAGSASGYYSSADNGITWTVSGLNLPAGIPCNALYYTGNKIFAGNMQGVFFSADHGQVFTNASQGMDSQPNRTVLSFTATPTELMAGLGDNGTWKRPFVDFSATGLSNISNAGLLIYPNPAHDKVYFEPGIIESKDAAIIITDITGRIIREINNLFSAGDLSWDVKSVPNGIYIVNFRDKDQLLSKRITVTH